MESYQILEFNFDTYKSPNDIVVLRLSNMNMMIKPNLFKVYCLRLSSACCRDHKLISCETKEECVQMKCFR